MTEPFKPEIEKWKKDLDVWQAQIEHRLDWQLESFKGVVQFALAAIRGVVLVNGGAAIAILAFLGNVWSKDEAVRVAAKAMVFPLTCFLGGVASGLATAAAAYMAQTFFSRYWNKTGTGFQFAGILLNAIGVAAFIVGALKAADVFTRGFG